jgi:hypothetical protein
MQNGDGWTGVKSEDGHFKSRGIQRLSMNVRSSRTEPSAFGKGRPQLARAAAR